MTVICNQAIHQNFGNIWSLVEFLFVGIIILLIQLGNKFPQMVASLDFHCLMNSSMDVYDLDYALINSSRYGHMCS